MNGSGRRQALSKPFIISKNERLVLNDGTSCGGPELRAVEWRNLWPVKIVARVKDAVAIEEESGPMKLICARLGDCINHCARGSTVFRSVPSRNHGKFLHRIYAQIQSGRAARCGVGIVIDCEAVQAVRVLVRAMARIRQLVTKAAVALVRVE